MTFFAINFEIFNKKGYEIFRGISYNINENMRVKFQSFSCFLIILESPTWHNNFSLSFSLSLTIKKYNYYFSENKLEEKPNLKKRPSGRTIKQVLETRFREAISDVQKTGSNKRKIVPKENNIISSNSEINRKTNGTTINVVSSANLRARRSVVKMLMVC